MAIFMIIDVHTHLWLSRIEMNKRAILDAFEVYGYEKAYVSGLSGAYPTEDEVKTLNDAVAKFANENPGKIGGYCYLNPTNGNTMHELRSRIENDGLAGVKLWIATFCDDPLVFPIAEYCAENNLPLLLHALDKSVGQYPHESTGVNVRNLALRYPELKIIMAHLGGNEYTGLKTIDDCPNVYADISGILYRNDTLRYAIKKIGVSRLLYGTDMSTDDPFWHVVGRVEALDITDDEKKMIYRENAARLGMT